jgi:hypothetical protein
VFVVSSLQRIPAPSNFNVFSIIRQEYSWGRFQITLDTFQKLLIYEGVFPAFLDCVHAFGFKIDEDEKVWDGFRTYIPGSDQNYEGFGSSVYPLYSTVSLSHSNSNV